MYEKETLDARPFPQIWGLLSKSEREDLTLLIYNAKICKTRQTIWKWGRGECGPMNRLLQNEVAKCVSKITGTRVSGQTLFPNS